jgi:hypothetical protein
MGQKATTMRKAEIGLNSRHRFKSSRESALLVCAELPQREEFTDSNYDGDFLALTYAVTNGWDDVVTALLSKKWGNVRDRPRIKDSYTLSNNTAMRATLTAKANNGACIVALLKAHKDPCKTWNSESEFVDVVGHAMVENWDDALDVITTCAAYNPWLLIGLATHRGHPAIACRVIQAYAAGETGCLAYNCTSCWPLSRVVGLDSTLPETLLTMACAVGPDANDVAAALVRSGDGNVNWNDCRALKLARKTGMSEEVIELLANVQRTGYYQTT